MLSKSLQEGLILKGSFRRSIQKPKVDRIVLNLGMRKKEKKKILVALLYLESLTGQKALTTRSKKVVVHLKIRKHMIVGAKVTLRGETCERFLDKLNTNLFPRTRSFQGFHGERLINKENNISFRISNPLSFMDIEPLIDLYDDLPFLDVTILTKGTLTQNETKTLLSAYTLPFKYF